MIVNIREFPRFFPNHRYGTAKDKLYLAPHPKH
jgi:hypothetical protein